MVHSRDFENLDGPAGFGVQFQDVEAFREEVDRLQATGPPKRGRRQMSLLPVDELPRTKPRAQKSRKRKSKSS